MILMLFSRNRYKLYQLFREQQFILSSDTLLSEEILRSVVSNTVASNGVPISFKFQAEITLCLLQHLTSGQVLLIAFAVAISKWLCRTECGERYDARGV